MNCEGFYSVVFQGQAGGGAGMVVLDTNLVVGRRNWRAVARRFDKPLSLRESLLRLLFDLACHHNRSIPLGHTR
jgi:hypothetical protein